jgi:hypothetical protein
MIAGGHQDFVNDSRVRWERDQQIARNHTKLYSGIVLVVEVRIERSKRFDRRPRVQAAKQINY